MKFLIFGVTILLMSCAKGDEKRKYFREIRDDSLKNTIRRYIKETGVDLKSHFVTVEYELSGSKSLCTISTGKSIQGIIETPPDYYAILDNAIVILRITNGDLVTGDDISKEIDHVMETQGIKLKANQTNYDPPFWILKKCENTYQLIKEWDVMRLDHLPCDYHLKRNSTMDSLILEKIY